MKREKKETGQLEFHEENLDPRGGGWEGELMCIELKG
jgi:hypothetical protein